MMPAKRNLLIFAAVLAAPLTGLSAVPAPLEKPAPSDRQVEDAIRSLREMIFPTGDRVEKWDVGGVDLLKAVREMGADRHYLLETDSDGTVLVSIVTDRPIADFAPASWRVVETYGSPGTPFENPSVTFGHLTPRFVVAGRSNNRRAGDADCMDKLGHAVLYEVPGVPPVPEDKDMPEFFKGFMVAADGYTLCSRYDGDRVTGYTVRVFRPDGRLVLNPDRTAPSSRITIVPAAPVDSLIRPPPLPAEPTPRP